MKKKATRKSRYCHICGIPLEKNSKHFKQTHKSNDI